MSDMANPSAAFVRDRSVAPLPPPLAASGAIGWLRQNLFSSALNVLLTALCVLLVIWIVPPLVRFLLVDAVWQGEGRDACLATPAYPEIGACWAFVSERINFFVYGFYPIDGRWRVDAFFVLLAAGIGWMAWLNAPRRDLGLI
jgi:general L-amino acid transport system permease protein